MKKLLLIFIFAIGLAFNASATKDTVYCSVGPPSSTFVLPIGKITSTTTLFTPTADPTKQLYVEVGDTLIFKTIGGTIDFTINGVSHNGMSPGSSFQQIISLSDAPSIIVSASYSYISVYFTIPLHIIITKPKYSLAFVMSGATMQTNALSAGPIGIDTICVAVNDTLNIINSTGVPLNFTANSTIFNNISTSSSFQYKIKSTDLPGFYLTATYLSITKNVYVKVRSSLTTGLNEKTKTNNLTLFPNPTKNTFTVANLKAASISVYNQLGSLVKQHAFENENISVNIADLPQGIYMVEVLADGKRSVSKLVKE